MTVLLRLSVILTPGVSHCEGVLSDALVTPFHMHVAQGTLVPHALKQRIIHVLCNMAGRTVLTQFMLHRYTLHKEDVPQDLI